MSLISWHKIAVSRDTFIQESATIKEIQVQEKRLCLVFNDGQLFAISALCPHAGGVFENGYIDRLGNIVCPVHHYRFNLSNGRNTSGEGYHLKTYPVEEREDGIYVGL